MNSDSLNLRNFGCGHPMGWPSMQPSSCRLRPFLSIVLLCSVLGGCGMPRRLTDQEKSDYAALARAEVVVEKKSPGTAIGLGFAPFAMGSIYSDQWVVLGVTDFVLWPVSILWSPINSWSRVRETNYRATVEALGPDKIRQIGELDRQRASGVLTDVQYLERARQIAGAPTNKP